MRKGYPAAGEASKGKDSSVMLHLALKARFLTCGSIDDGKSRLIGRLLYESALLFDSPYERPENPEIRIDTTAMSAEAAAEQLVAHLRATDVLGPV